MSCRVEETKTLETLLDTSGLHPVRNLQRSVSCGVEETKTLETLHDPSGLHPVWNPQTSVSWEIEETKTLETLHDPSGLHQVPNPQTSTIPAKGQSIPYKFKPFFGRLLRFVSVINRGFATKYYD